MSDIPNGVYFSMQTNDFHSNITDMNMGGSFWHLWQSKRREFPSKPPPKQTTPTDYEKLKTVLVEIGMHPDEILTRVELGNKVLRLEEGAGYPGFICDFYFVDGKFDYHKIIE